MIKEVILENFKSYYGEHRILCGSHFNAIIGPNGSGKSNFIDAIQFVFGKRATSMRCKTISQLISTGRQESRVEVIFDGFTLKRTIKGNTTEVFIDNEPVKQTKLHQYLKEHFKKQNKLRKQMFLIYKYNQITQKIYELKNLQIINVRNQQKNYLIEKISNENRKLFLLIHKVQQKQLRKLLNNNGKIVKENSSKVCDYLKIDEKISKFKGNSI